MSLYQINHDYRSQLWCGIAALAAVTGQPTSVCRRAVLEARDGYGSTQVTGITRRELRGAFALLGYGTTEVQSFTHIERRHQPTLAAWLKTRRGVLATGTLVISTTRHWCVVEGRRFVDSHQVDPVWLRDAHCRRSRVGSVYYVTKICKPSLLLETEAPEFDPDRKVRGKAKALAAKHRIRIDTSEWRERRHIWVTCPALKGSADPFEGDHIATDWEEVLARVLTYVSARTGGAS